MELVKWTQEYSVGIKEIDNQHQGLIIIINELFNLMTVGKAKDNLIEIFDHLTDYSKKHFFAEELMMVKYAYNDYQQHKNEHAKFIEKLNGLKSDFANGKVTISLEVLSFLKDWLINHIQISDKKYAPHISKMILL